MRAGTEGKYQQRAKPNVLSRIVNRQIDKTIK